MRNQKIDAAIKSAKEKAVDIFSDLPSELITGVRTLFLIERAKDGCHNKEERRNFNFTVVDSEEKILKKITEFLWIKELYPNNKLRIYLSVNARNKKRAVRNIHESIITSLYSDEETQEQINTKISKGARSYIMNPNARETKYFLIDVDNEPGKDIMGEILHEMARLDIKEIYRRSTRNGWHIVVHPFNLGLWKGTAEIKKDGLILLD